MSWGRIWAEVELDSLFRLISENGRSCNLPFDAFSRVGVQPSLSHDSAQTVAAGCGPFMYSAISPRRRAPTFSWIGCADAA